MPNDNPQTTTYLRCPGVGRDAEYDRSLVLYFNRRASDDEMRRIHNAVQEMLDTDTVMTKGPLQ